MSNDIYNKLSRRQVNRLTDRQREAFMISDGHYTNMNEGESRDEVEMIKPTVYDALEVLGLPGNKLEILLAKMRARMKKGG